MNELGDLRGVRMSMLAVLCSDAEKAKDPEMRLSLRRIAKRYAQLAALPDPYPEIPLPEPLVK